MREPAHRKRHPFGQIPTYEEGDLALFESGSIIFHIATKPYGLAAGRRRCAGACDCMDVAALNTVEPPIAERGTAVLLERDKSWYTQRLPILEDRVHVRLSELADHLDDADWLDSEFSAADLLMVTVLRRLNGSGMLERYPNLYRLCGPWRGATCLQARFCCATGGFKGGAGGC